MKSLIRQEDDKKEKIQKQIIGNPDVCKLKRTEEKREYLLR